MPEDRFLVSVGWIALGDFDADGAIDVLASTLARTASIGLGDGNGGGWVAGIPAAGDLDGDGDVDIFLGQLVPRGPNVVWMNTTE